MASLSGQGADLELGEHPHFEKKWYAVQAVIFWVMVVLVIAGIVGVFGTGPLAWGRARFAGLPFGLEYQRFGRTQASSQLAIEPREAPPGQVMVHIDRGLIETMGIQNASPAPLASASDIGGTVYVFALTAGANGPISFKTQPQKPGIARGRISINGREQTLTQIVWP